MRYRDAAAFRQALEQRLKSRTSGDGARLSQYRKRVVFDRLLARLVAAAPDRWLLKGGFALDLRLRERARATKDVDVDWHATEGELLEAIIDTGTYDAGDFFEFAIERGDTLADRLGGSHRFRVAAALAGRPFESFALDVGLRDDALTYAEYLTAPSLLAFAGIGPVTVRVLPLESQTAEKLHAYTRTYEGDRPSSRSKDLVDLALIAALSPLEATALHEAIHATFARRGTHPLPRTLPPPPEDWRTAFRRLAETVGVPPELTHAHADAAAMINPILIDSNLTRIWDPERRRWCDDA
jgi:Nucleotidyl transferase AbiEii toxin, Type IV TA system